MKRSAFFASIFVFLFFLFFNGLQVYLIIERISETKTKYGNACMAALVSTLNEYNKQKAIDSASRPTNGWITYAPKKIEISRIDSHTVKFTAPYSSLMADTVEPGFIETVVNTHAPAFKTIDLQSFSKLYQNALRTQKVNAEHRLDTFSIPGRRLDRQLMLKIWNEKKREDYYYQSGPMRTPFNVNLSLFSQVKKDNAFFKNDLWGPMLAFALILLIGNAALLFVYRTIRKQKKINEMKTDFINNITHEMKTPITIASAGLDALEHHVSPTDRTNFYLHTSKKQLLLLNEFVERILDSAVQDISGYTLKKERIDLHTLFDELIQSHSLLNGKAIKFELTGEGPVNIQGDRLHLETAFHNIIDNAIKYSNESVSIHIDIAENTRDAIIKIRDDGMGIPPQFVKNIFDKFFRVPQGDAQSVKGFGLGLYYVSNILKKHSGNISVSSKYQLGTEFVITLPKNP